MLKFIKSAFVATLLYTPVLANGQLEFEVEPDEMIDHYLMGKTFVEVSVPHCLSLSFQPSKKGRRWLVAHIKIGKEKFFRELNYDSLYRKGYENDSRGIKYTLGFHFIYKKPKQRKIYDKELGVHIELGNDEIKVYTESKMERYPIFTLAREKLDEYLRQNPNYGHPFESCMTSDKRWVYELIPKDVHPRWPL